MCRGRQTETSLSEKPVSILWRLPFRLPSPKPSRVPRCCRALARAGRPPEGMLVQGVDGASTHRDELSYAYDWALAVGTPVLAARAGVVVEACDVFRAGAPKPEYRPLANHVVLRHADGLYSRYFHLKQGSLRTSVGAAVSVGQPIAASGNTGFSSGPHLHFDVTDSTPTETSLLSVERTATQQQRAGGAAGAGATDTAADATDAAKEAPPPPGLVSGTVKSAAAAFCFALPPASSPLSPSARREGQGSARPPHRRASARVGAPRSYWATLPPQTRLSPPATAPSCCCAAACTLTLSTR